MKEYKIKDYIENLNKKCFKKIKYDYYKDVISGLDLYGTYDRKKNPYSYKINTVLPKLLTITKKYKKNNKDSDLKGEEDSGELHLRDTFWIYVQYYICSNSYLNMSFYQNIFLYKSSFNKYIHSLKLIFKNKFINSNCRKKFLDTALVYYTCIFIYIKNKYNIYLENVHIKRIIPNNKVFKYNNLSFFFNKMFFLFKFLDNFNLFLYIPDLIFKNKNTLIIKLKYNILKNKINKYILIMNRYILLPNKFSYLPILKFYFLQSHTSNIYIFGKNGMHNFIHNLFTSYINKKHQNKFNFFERTSFKKTRINKRKVRKIKIIRDRRREVWWNFLTRKVKNIVKARRFKNIRKFRKVRRYKKHLKKYIFRTKMIFKRRLRNSIKKIVKKTRGKRTRKKGSSIKFLLHYQQVYNNSTYNNNNNILSYLNSFFIYDIILCNKYNNKTGSYNHLSIYNSPLIKTWKYFRQYGISLFYWLHHYVFKKKISKNFFLIKYVTCLLFKKIYLSNIIPSLTNTFFFIVNSKKMYYKYIYKYKFIWSLYLSIKEKVNYLDYINKKVFTNVISKKTFHYYYIKYYLLNFWYLFYYMEKTIEKYTNNNCFLIFRYSLRLKNSLNSAKMWCEYIIYQIKKKITIRKLFFYIKKQQIFEKEELEKCTLSNNVSNKRIINYKYPLKGIRILYKGNFKKAKRKKKLFYYVWVSDNRFSGKMTLKQFKYYIDYHSLTAKLKRSSIGIKFWLLYNIY